MRPKPGEKTRYQTTIDVIMRRIVAGEYPPGSPLPSMAVMAEQLGVSRSLMKQVFAALAEQGMIVRRNRATALAAASVGRKILPIASVWVEADCSYADGPFGWHEQRHLTQALLSRNFPHLMLSYDNMNDARWRAFPGGVIFMVSGSDSAQMRRNLILDNSFCHMTMVTYAPHPEPNQVYLDYRKMLVELADYFCGRQVATLVIVNHDKAMDSDVMDEDRNRYAVLYRSMRKRGLPAHAVHLARVRGIAGMPEPDQLQELCRLPRPLGIIANGDFIALNLLRCLEGMRMRCRKDFFIVGASGLPEIAHQPPYLSTFQIPFEEHSVAAVEALLKRMEHPGTDIDPIGIPVKLEINNT